MVHAKIGIRFLGFALQVYLTIFYSLQVEKKKTKNLK